VRHTGFVGYAQATRAWAKAYAYPDHGDTVTAHTAAVHNTAVTRSHSHPSPHRTKTRVLTPPDNLQNRSIRRHTRPSRESQERTDGAGSAHPRGSRQSDPPAASLSLSRTQSAVAFIRCAMDRCIGRQRRPASQRGKSRGPPVCNAMPVCVTMTICAPRRGRQESIAKRARRCHRSRASSVRRPCACTRVASEHRCARR